MNGLKYHPAKPIAKRAIQSGDLRAKMLGEVFRHSIRLKPPMRFSLHMFSSC